MKHLFFLFSVCLLLLATTAAQAQLNYGLSSFAGTYTPISTGGGATTWTGAAGDDVTQSNVPIGFTFNYLGTDFTTVAICNSGWVSFNGASTSTSFTNGDMYTTSGPNNALFPWFDDHNFTLNSVTGTAPTILYQTQGSAPNRTFTVQWVNVNAGRTAAGGSALNFQVIIYETTNVIEFWYGPRIIGTYQATQSASIGIEGATGGVGNYLDAMTGSSRCGHYYLAENQWPAYNFRFTPGVPAALAAGTYTVGSGGAYKNLSDAVADVQQRGISGAITLNLTDAVYDTSAVGGNNFFPILIGPVTGTSSTNTITISKTGSPATIRWGGNITGNTSGSMVNQASTAINGSNVEPIFGLVGVDFLTLNNVDIRGNVGFQNADHAIGVYNSSATDGSQNNTFSNFSTIMRRANTGSRGVVMNTVTTPSAATGANSNNTFRDFSITNSYAGIGITGNATWPDLNTTINRTLCTTFNTIGDPATANDIGNGTSAAFGISASNQNGLIVRNNSIRNVTASGTVAVDGITLSGLQGNTDCSNNIIRTVRNASTTATTAMSGIRVAHSTTGTVDIRVYNNSVSEITSGYTGTASATKQIKGIFLSGTTGSTSNTYSVFNNSVSIDGSGSPNISNVCLETTQSASVFLIRNNVLANWTAAQGATARHHGVAHTSATTIGGTGSLVTNNDIFIANDAGVSGFTAQGSTTNYNGVTAWQAAITSPAGSVNSNLEINPLFTNNNTDLHAGAAGLNGGGVAPPAYITTDLDCATRTPDNDIGAYILNACTGAIAGTISGTSVACQGTDPALSLTGASTGLGISYQWFYGTTPGGPYPNALGTSNTQSTVVLSSPGTYYIIAQVTCSSGPVTATTPEFVFTRNQTPTASAGSNSPICVGQTLNLTGTTDVGAVFSWTGPNGFSSTVQNPSIPNTSLVASGTYTFIASLNGCPSVPATTSVVIAPQPTITATTATPNPVCIGSNSQLNVTALVDVPFVRITEITFFRTGTGQTSPWPPSIPTGPDDYVELNNTSGLPADISGWTYADYSTGSATANHSITFPAGTVIPPNGYIVIGLATGTNDPANFYYAATGSSGFYTSGANACFILRDASSVIIDAVATNTATFNAGLGVTPTDWSGSGASAPSGNAGSRRTAALDSNTGADWTASSAPGGTQTIGTFNPGYTNTNQSAPASYLWSPNTYLDFNNISNPFATGVIASTTYTVTVTSNVGCTAQSTVTLTASGPITAATITPATPAFCTGGSVTLTATPSDGGAPFTYAWAGPGGPAGAAATQAANVAGLWTVTVTDNCGGNVVVSTTVAEIAPPGGSATGPATGLTYQNLVYTATGFTGTPNFQWQFATVLTGPYTNVGTNSPSFTAIANGGATYYIQCVITDPVTGCATTTNVVTTVVSVAGDNVCEAIPLAVGTNGPFTNVGATTETGEPVPPSTGFTTQTGWGALGISNSVWYSFVCPPSGRISINLDPALNQWDGQLALYSAPDCGAILSGGATLLAANDDGITGLAPYQPIITPICLTPGVTYYVQLDGFGTTTNNNFGLVLNQEPALVTASISAAPTSVCSGGNADITFTGTPNATVTYNIDGGSPLTTVLTGGTSVVNTGALTTPVTYNLVSVTNGACTQIFTGVSATVTIAPNVSAGTVSGTTPLCLGATATFTSTGGTTGGTWSSDNTGVATVDPSSGLVTAQGQGSANITYTVNTGCGSPVSASAPVTVNALDYANLQFPASGTVTQGCIFTAYGQVYELGLTEAPGPGAGIVAEFGIGLLGTNPNTWTNWTPASFNVQFGNNDEYWFNSNINLLPGTYNYTFRYSYPGCPGAWQYGGFPAGFWDGTTHVSGVLTVNPQPAQPPVVNCWDNFVFNTTTCAWENTGSQPAQPPVVNCWDNFVFNTTTCAWENTGSQPAQPPVVNCWDNFVFNTTTCAWVNTGSQPAQPPVVNCWDNFVFNTTTCSWVNTGSQPAQPPVVNCWDNFVFNTTTCAWENTGSQPAQPPVVNCWDNFVFNTTTCAWVNTGSQPAQPPVVNCWDNFVFNTTTCAWVNTGSQPAQPPVVNCWDNFVFNTTTCAWVNTGSQPAQPPVVNCWDNFVFNTTTCAWVNTGSQPAQPPVVNCWDNFVFNTTTCAWENTGSQPAQPTGLACWETATFNTTTCVWDVTGTQPPAPTGLACWQTATFNTTTCVWDVTGTPPPTASINPNATAICVGTTTTLTATGGGTYAWSNGLGNTATVTVNAAGTYTVTVTNGSCTATAQATVATFNCNVTISDPCSCNNDATPAANDGTFNEVAALPFVSSGGSVPADFVVTVLSSTGTTGLPNGTVLTFNSGLQQWETPVFTHVDNIGYSLTVEVAAAAGNGLGLPAGTLIGSPSISNKCAYPNPVVSGLAGSYCTSGSGGTPDTDITATLTGSPAGPAGTFTLTGTGISGGPVTYTFTPPATAGPVTISGSYTGGNDGNGGVSPDGGTTPAFPGCIQPFGATTNAVECPPGCNASPTMQWNDN